MKHGKFINAKELDLERTENIATEHKNENRRRTSRMNCAMQQLALN